MYYKFTAKQWSPENLVKSWRKKRLVRIVIEATAYVLQSDFFFLKCRIKEVNIAK